MDIEDFINNYTQKDKSKIDINFIKEQDINCAFRDSISKELTTKQIGSIELIRDIFFIEGEYCKAIWGSTYYLNPLAELFLKKGGADVVDEYFEVKDISFDTSCVIDAYGLKLEELEEILQGLKEIKQKEPNKQNIDFNLGYFEEKIKEKTK